MEKTETMFSVPTFERSDEKCFLCGTNLVIGIVEKTDNDQSKSSASENKNSTSKNSTNKSAISKGCFCAKCAEKYDPNVFPIPNVMNCAYYDKLPDGRQTTCAKILGPRNQHWYHCINCFPDVNNKGFCIYCSQSCVKNKHVLQLKYCAFICDSLGDGA